MAFSYEIIPRPMNLGGGWKLVLLEDGEEVGGGVFPPDEDLIDSDAKLAEIAAYDAALAEASAWIMTR